MWQRTREVIHSLPAEDTDRIVVPHIGGGTLLAARWKHRLSTDIDILLPGPSSPARSAAETAPATEPTPSRYSPASFGRLTNGNSTSPR